MWENNKVLVNETNVIKSIVIGPTEKFITCCYLDNITIKIFSITTGK